MLFKTALAQSAVEHVGGTLAAHDFLRKLPPTIARRIGTKRFAALLRDGRGPCDDWDTELCHYCDRIARSFHILAWLDGRDVLAATREALKRAWRNALGERHSIGELSAASAHELAFMLAESLSITAARLVAPSVGKGEPITYSNVDRWISNVVAQPTLLNVSREEIATLSTAVDLEGAKLRDPSARNSTTTITTRERPMLDRWKEAFIHHGGRLRFRIIDGTVAFPGKSKPISLGAGAILEAAGVAISKFHVYEGPSDNDAEAKLFFDLAAQSAAQLIADERLPPIHPLAPPDALWCAFVHRRLDGKCAEPIRPNVYVYDAFRASFCAWQTMAAAKIPENPITSISNGSFSEAVRCAGELLEVSANNLPAISQLQLVAFYLRDVDKLKPAAVIDRLVELAAPIKEGCNLVDVQKGGKAVARNLMRNRIEGWNAERDTILARMKKLA